MKNCAGYVDQFLGLNCSTDILEVLRPITSGFSKEISEAMTIFKRMKWVVSKPNQYNLLEMCAGNPITSALCAFVLPLTNTISVDLHKVNRDYTKFRKFHYVEQNIFKDEIFNLVDENTILVGVHACNDLSKRIIEIYLKSPAKHLYLMPCCHPNVVKPKRFIFLDSQIGSYKTWCFHLAELCNGSIDQDVKCLSGKNIVVQAHKDNLEILETND